MNFSLSAIALALSTTATNAHLKLSNTHAAHSPVTKALLRHARPYSSSNSRRSLEDNLNGSYNIKFSQCVDVKTYDEDNHAQYADSIAAGTVTPSASFVIFHVCTDYTCSYEGTGDLYIVDLKTYLGTVAMYHAEKKGKFCEACNEFEDVCNATDDATVTDDATDDAADDGAAAEEEDQPEEEDNREEENRQEEDNREEDNPERNRKLKSTQRRTTKVAIDCDQCQSNSCYVQNNDDSQDLDEQAAEWIQQVSECQKADIQINGTDVYYGAMCDQYGDGVELAVFLDDKCSLYTSQVGFKNVYTKEEGSGSSSYLNYAEKYIKTAFSDVMSCDNVEYYAASDDDQGANGDDNNEMNDYCKGILDEDALSYSNCDADEDGEQVTDEGYSYDLAYGEDDLDIEEVCAVVKRMENAGEYFNAYDSSTSGTWYKRDKKGKIIVESQNQGLSGGAIFGVIVAVAAAVGGAAFVMMKKKKKKGDIAESAEYQGGSLS